MAQITKEKLAHLTNDEIKSFFITENIEDYHVQPIRKFVEGGRDMRMMGNRINRVEKILGLIIVDRFINGQIK